MAAVRVSRLAIWDTVSFTLETDRMGSKAGVNTTIIDGLVQACSIFAALH